MIYLTAITVVMALVAACGGGAAASPAKTAATAPGPTLAGGQTSAAPATGAVAATAGAQLPATGGDPCRVMTQAEISTALGSPVGPGKQVATLQDCVWSSADFRTGADVTFSDWVSIDNAAHANNAKPAAVSGIGDEAYTGIQGSLYVRKGDQGFLLLLTSPLVDHATDNGVAIAKILAASILAHM